MFLQLTLRATDQRIIERTDDANVFINVIRDTNPPFFVNEPYGLSISENRFNEIIYTGVEARDNDLQVTIRMFYTCS